MKKYFRYRLFKCINGGRIFFKSEELSYSIAMNITKKDVVTPYNLCNLEGYQIVTTKSEAEAKQILHDFLENTKYQHEKNYINLAQNIDALLEILD